MRRFFVGVLALLLLAAVSLAALHTYYHFTPVELSEEARSLDRRAAALPRDTDNGLRLLGLLAPREIDPVTFGRCLLDAERRFWSDFETDRDLSPSVSAAEIQALSERLLQATKVRNERCAGGQRQLQTPDSKALPPLTLDSTTKDWHLWAGVEVDPMLWVRYEQVMGTDPRYLAPSMYSSGIENFGALSVLHRIRMAQAKELWAAERREAALDIWELSMQQWSQIAPESLISNMLAVAAMSQTFASMHAAWSQGTSGLDPALSDRAKAITHLANQLPAAIEASAVTEWALTSSVLRSTESLDELANIKDRLLGYTHDMNHTLNLLAEMATAREAFLRSTATGRSDMTLSDPPCSVWPTWKAGSPACLFLGRNPVGQILANVSLRTYADYGTRVADLLNFAAATRFIASLHARPPQSEAVTQAVQEAPSDQRDIYTGRPFAVDPTGPVLRVPLKQRNPVLGDPGEYRLPL